MTASLPVSRFWRDDALPHLELRSVRDGRQVCHARHAHETFSVGLVTGGRSSYLNGTSRQHIGAGTLVLMNPGDVHACNPLGDRPWAYHMLYVDAGWLGELQQELDGGTGFRPFRAIRSDDAELRTGLSRLVATLTSEDREPLARQARRWGSSRNCTNACNRARRSRGRTTGGWSGRPNTSPSSMPGRSGSRTSAARSGCRRPTSSAPSRPATA